MGLLLKDYGCLYDVVDIAAAVVASGLTSAATLEEVVDNTYYFDTTTKAIRIKSAAGSNGTLCLYFSDAQIADLFDVECEIRIISGDLPLMAVGENLTTKGQVVAANTVGEWQTVKLKHLITSVQGYKKITVVCGLVTVSAGEFEMRNFRVAHYSKNFKRNGNLPQIKKFFLKNNAGTIELASNSTYSSDNATVEALDARNIKITYTTPFTGRRPVAVVANGNDATYGLYEPKTYDSLNTSITFKFWNGTAFVDLSAVPNGIYFTIVVFGD